MRNGNELLSVIIPCYNEAVGIQVTIDTITKVLTEGGLRYELIFVSDGSRDETFSIIAAAARKDPRIKGVSFCRNFGKEAAMLAGLQYAQGDCAVVIDSDLQHPPECILEMYRLYQQGYDIVEGVKEERQKEGLLHRAFANVFYAIFDSALGMDVKNASDFKLISRRVIDVLRKMPERERFFRGLTFWTGFKMTSVTYTVQPRYAGVTKWSFTKLVKYAVQNIISFSTIPLHFITWIGVFMLVLGVFFAIRALRLYFTGLAAGGITTVVVLILISSGLILIALSIIGRYIASIYNEIKARPQYLVDQTVGIEEDVAQQAFQAAF